MIFAVGNAPTALIQIYELMQERDWRPAFVIGVPVGFVNVEAAKELIIETDVPYIINRGRKVAATWQRPSAMLCCMNCEKNRKTLRPAIDTTDHDIVTVR